MGDRTVERQMVEGRGLGFRILGLGVLVYALDSVK